MLPGHLESKARLSPSGDNVLAVKDSGARHGAVIIDTGTGESWQVPKKRLTVRDRQ